MAASARHKEVSDKVIEILQSLTIPGIESDQIYLTRFPFTSRPSMGLAVSHITESEGAGLNDVDDVAYPVQLTRILHKMHPNDGVSDTSLWRDTVRRRFNRTRMGITGCELVTRVEFSTIEIPKIWNDWNVDASVLQIICWMRETRDV